MGQQFYTTISSSAADPPTYYPYGEPPAQVPDAPALDLDSLLPPSSDSRTGRGFTFTSTLDYARAYRSGATTPEEVARKILDRVRATQLYAIIKWDEAVRTLLASLVLYTARSRASTAERAEGCGAVHPALP